MRETWLSTVRSALSPASGSARSAIWPTLVVLAAACGDVGFTGETLPILEPYAFRPAPAERDPLADHRPRDVACPPAAWAAEGGGSEVQTGVCA